MDRDAADVNAAIPHSGLRMRSLVLTSLLLAVTPGWAAPKDSVNRFEGPAAEPIPNLLHPEPEELRLLQSYLQSVRQMAQDPAHMTREQVLLYLFALHDYDRTGQLDGLEFMQLLLEVISQHAQGQPSPEAVVVVVDGILETQDLNRDGLLNPSELLLPPAQGQPPLPAQTEAPDGEGVVQWAGEEPEQPATALALAGAQGVADPGVELPEAAGPLAEEPEAGGLLLSRTGPEVAQPKEEPAKEAPGAPAGAPNAEI
ncbi:cell growth regulator with EF hand domain protein 1 isoform X2 [Dermochelys coriacea]|uniref:cell growth regulator with EF hand domain protein 1 isoform X2 n=1 Tax=Dermochelys coriacea TaxID=27794 RepID=UPI0018E7C73E|nr:cell growth regulator with EF hand domain protein 1 isoform X2 [Dermochelys coriacea]